jgi:DNA modification methylase
MQFTLFPSASAVDDARPTLPLAYRGIEGDIPVDLAQGAFISVQREPALKIHSVGFQPAKSIPEIARWFIQKYLRDSALILDPFCGSGTTLIEALRCGMMVRWLDYNPLSRLICSVKSRLFDRQHVMEEASRVLMSSLKQKNAPCTVSLANKDFWFQKPVQEGLEILREHIACGIASVQPILWLCLAATVRKTSDMNEGMILAAKRSHVKEIPRRERADVFNHFRLYLEKTMDAIDEWQRICGSRFNKASELAITDARELGSVGNTALFDAVVTSPPYINAIDYVWASKFELHWLGLVKNDSDRLSLYTKEIGTERIDRRETRQLGRTGHKMLDELIEDIYTGKEYRATPSQNHLRARVTYKYFLDMKKHFESCHSLLRNGGLYCFTIGDKSRICGVEVPVALILAEFAEEAGFERVFDFHLLLRNRRLNIPRNVAWASTIKHDTTVVLRKS